MTVVDALKHIKIATDAIAEAEPKLAKAARELAWALEIIMKLEEPSDPYADTAIRPGLNKIGQETKKDEANA